MTRHKESYDAGGWWRQPLALLPLKAGIANADLATAMGVSRVAASSWTCQRVSQRSPLLAQRTALVIEVIRHASSAPGEAFLWACVNRMTQWRRDPVARAGRFMREIYMQPIAPPDYSWALFTERLQAQVWRGEMPPSFKTREEWVEFAGRWRHPRQIAKQLELPDPRLANFDDSQIPAKDFDPRGKPWQDPPPQPTPPNQPPTPPVPIAGFG